MLIATCSTDEAAAALGLRPPTVRKFIKTGKLAAARVGKTWRVGIESVNALLSSARSTPSAALPKLPELVASKTVACATSEPVVAATVQPEQVASKADACVNPPLQISVPRKPALVAPYPDASDQYWLGHYRAQLLSSDPAVKENAEYHLGMLTKRAESQSAWKRPAEPVQIPYQKLF